VRLLLCSPGDETTSIGRVFSPGTLIFLVNYALRLLQSKPQCSADVAVQAGFFDQPHFIHDFKAVCGLTPQEYKQNMSVFYNDRFKM
jgi:hypothetical protein